MNTTESIVESYYRLCKGCFTQPDVKVLNGNNRQIDLLAYNVTKQLSYHVEVSVTHCQRWCPTFESLKESFDKKFFGIPPKREGPNTDFSRNKTYKRNIEDTYQHLGLHQENILRVWVCWTLLENENIENDLKKYCIEKNLPDGSLKILSFRDEVLPELLEKVSTSNYEDDSLRTLSLLRQYQKQTEA
jgi:hypothetical protein